MNKEKKSRAIVFCEDSAVRNFLKKALVKSGYGVTAFSDPRECATLVDFNGICRKECACADVLIIGRHMKGVRGLDFVEKQIIGGCKIPLKNKVIISSAYEEAEQKKARRLGIPILHVPFGIDVLKQWLDSCEKTV